MSDPSLPLDPRAEELFREHLTRLEGCEPGDFEAMCRANPTLAHDLRELKRAIEIARRLNSSSGDRPLSERLKQKFGADPGPTLSLDDEPRPDSAASGTLFEKLRGGGTRGTRYRLLGEVARGGMGVILKIWDDELRRTLAMKVVLGRGDESKGDTPHVDPKTLGRFLEEAQVTGQLDHPGIVPVHELGLAANGSVYFTMRLVKGEELRSIFEKVRTGEDGWNQVRALGVMLKVCEAMSYAHSKKVVHRDLKPANVMVGKFGEVYVMDWGLARVLGREDKHDLRIRPQQTTQSVVKTERREKREETPDSPLVTMDGEVVGTPSFMPPEQAKGQLDRLGPHSDVYSLGAMLYQLLTGEVPYIPKGSVVSQRTILAAVLRHGPEPIESLAPSTPPELAAICEKAMAREVSTRYGDTEALAADLRAYLEGRVVRAYETGAWAEARKWVRRNKPLAASLAAAVVTLIIGVVTSTAFASRATEKATALEQANTTILSKSGEIQSKNTELESKNAALDKAKSEAEQKTNDVLSLSAQEDLDGLVARAEKLWPAQPGLIAEYEAWMSEARELIGGRAADSAKGLKKRPSLEEHRAKLAELRSKARPLTVEQAKAERESHPKYAELLVKQSELSWHSRMLGMESWPSVSAIEAELAMETLPGDANELNTLAWTLVDPGKPVYGQEVRALLLAQRAVAAASESERRRFRVSLAWALFRLGRLDEALAEENAAVIRSIGGEPNESAAKLDESVSAWVGDELTKRREQRDALAAEVSELDRVVSERHTFDYEDPDDRWWDVQLSKLVSDLERLRHPKTGLMGDALSESFGWGMRKRYEFAKNIEELSLAGMTSKKLWAEAITAVRSSPKYGGLELVPQLGLLPIGTDPDSGLCEFAHLQSGEPALRGAQGQLVLSEATGLVFVLIPGGTFWMGAQRTDPNGHNFDPLANPEETPVREVKLSAYFLSKYEMTQGQWLRFVGRNPSSYDPGTKFGDKTCSRLCPVEQVRWDSCTDTLRRLGLVLPTEAQWEYGARAGAQSAWWTGTEKKTMAGAANLADAYSKSHGGPRNWPYETWLDDGWTVHAPVGSYAPNAFGLHDVAGNVWEWCGDGQGAYSLPTHAGDGERMVNGSAFRVYRGGGFRNGVPSARSATRFIATPEFQGDALGLRPARSMTP